MFQVKSPSNFSGWFEAVELLVYLTGVLDSGDVYVGYGVRKFLRDFI